MTRSITICILAVLAVLVAAPSAATPPTPAEAREIAREAYVYGFPLVDSYRIVHAYYVDPQNPEYKAPFNTVKNIPRVYTPADRAVQTPNSDTPYSMAGLDLRTEPLVFTLPPIQEERYFSVQMVDAYTHNFDYLGSRTTGNAGGKYLVAGPSWSGETPPGIERVLRSETDLAMAIYRTQLFEPADLANVERIQAGYRVEPLSSFLGQPAPSPATPIGFIPPLTPEAQRTSLAFFDVLSFVLGFCPVVPAEQEMRARFERIGVGPGRTLASAGLSDEVRAAIAEGMADAWRELADFEATSIATGRVKSGSLFGTRSELGGNYLYRFAGAKVGIFGNSLKEAMYPIYQTDATGQALDASLHAYTLRFPPGQLPPVNAFWSVTMYDGKTSLLIENPLERYLINSPMLPRLVRDEDGGLTLYIQATSPGEGREANWLPAPPGPFLMAMRLYWPKPEALDGSWKPPALQRLEKGGR